MKRSIMLLLVCGVSLLFASSVSAQGTVGALSFDHLDPASYPTIELIPGELPIFMGLSQGRNGRLKINNVSDGMVECFGIDLFDPTRGPANKFHIKPHMSYRVDTVPTNDTWRILCFSEEEASVTTSQQRGRSLR